MSFEDENLEYFLAERVLAYLSVGARKSLFQETNQQMNERTYRRLHSNFFRNIRFQGITSNDLLRTLYLANYARMKSAMTSRKPVPTKTDVERNLIQTLASDYCSYSGVTRQDIGYEQQFTEFKNNFRIILRDVVNGNVPSNDSKVKQAFFDSLDRALSSQIDNKRTRKIVLRDTKKLYKYKDPKSTIKKAMLALGLSAAIFAPIVSGAINIPEVDNSASVPQSQTQDDGSITIGKISDFSNDDSLNELFKNPSDLTNYGVSKRLANQFEQYVLARQSLIDGNEFDSVQSQAYNLGRIDLIKSIAQERLEGSITSEFGEAPEDNSILITPSSPSSASIEFNVHGQDYSYTQRSQNPDEEASYLSLAFLRMQNARANSDLMQCSGNKDELDQAIEYVLHFLQSDISFDHENTSILENHNVTRDLNIDNSEVER